MPGGAHPYRTVVLEDESLRSLQGFTQIPNVVLKHSDISFGAKVAYGVLLSYAWTDDFCFPAQERLAKDLNCSVRQVQRLLTELKEQEFITWKQQGLNRPNIYYLLPIKRWNKPTRGGSPDTTDPSSPDTTQRSHQETTNASPKEDTRKNIQIVNERRSPLRDRSGHGRKTEISDEALRTTYGLSDDRIGRVHLLVDKQVETLGSAERNHAHYVKRAAEAVRDDRANLLDQMLGELKQVTKTIPLKSRPAYFHRMFTKALKPSSSESADSPKSDDATANDHPGVQHDRGGLFRPPEQADDPDPRSRLIDDAEQRGFSIPDHIRHADIPTTTRWWASLQDGSPTA